MSTVTSRIATAVMPDRFAGGPPCSRLTRVAESDSIASRNVKGANKHVPVDAPPPETTHNPAAPAARLRLMKPRRAYVAGSATAGSCSASTTSQPEYPTDFRMGSSAPQSIMPVAGHGEHPASTASRKLQVARWTSTSAPGRTSLAHVGRSPRGGARPAAGSRPRTSGARCRGATDRLAGHLH